MNLSIIIPASNPKSLTHVVNNINNQSIDGIDYEIIIVQESNGNFNQFNNIKYGPRFTILRQSLHFDCGAEARDRGTSISSGEYITYWDDDNLYYPHAVVSTFLAAVNYDIGVSRIRHFGSIIPINNGLKAGDIDTMCLCVRKDLSTKVSWADNGGRYNDYRWVNKLFRLGDKVNYSSVIIGEHL